VCVSGKYAKSDAEVYHLLALLRVCSSTLLVKAQEKSRRSKNLMKDNSDL